MLPLVLVDQHEDQGLYKYGVGTPPKAANPKPERVLMVLGATGVGKSTMINGLTNYVLGVKFSDTFRYKVVTDEGSGSQAHSQTKTITAYTFYPTILPYTLTPLGFATLEESQETSLLKIRLRHSLQDRIEVE